MSASSFLLLVAKAIYVIWAPIGEPLGELVNHVPLPLCFKPTANQTQEPDSGKNTLMLLAKLDGSMWLPPTCPPNLYLESYLSQNEVCKANHQSASSRDENSVPSSPLSATLPTHTRAGLPLVTGPTPVCLLPSCRF